MNEAFVLGALLLLGASVSLDERGLFATMLSSPMAAGLGAGLLVQDLTAGLAFGLLFHALYPVRVDSGGQVPPAAALGALSAVACLWAAGVRIGSFLATSDGAAANALEMNAETRLVERAAAFSALPLLAFGVGIGVAETARGVERLLRARNGRREARVLARLEEESSAEPTSWVRGAADPLDAIRSAQFRALGESAGRGAGAVLLAVSLGWLLGHAPLSALSAGSLPQVWRGVLLVAPLLAAAFLLRDLSFAKQATRRTALQGAPARPALLADWPMWFATLLGLCAGAMAMGWRG